MKLGCLLFRGQASQDSAAFPCEHGGRTPQDSLTPDVALVGQGGLPPPPVPLVLARMARGQHSPFLP